MREMGLARERQLNSKNGGFSLVEVVISMVILVLISIPLLNYFTDSLKASARMAQRQVATMLAQELTESMKSLERLIQFSEDDDQFGVPLLTDSVEDGGIGLAIDTVSSDFYSKGMGEIVFTGPYVTDHGTYDLRITLSTNVSANAVERPMIYGIDDATDVLAVEMDQRTEATIYFMAANSDYCNRFGGTPLDEAAVRAMTERIINMKIDWDGASYTVKVYYEYTCPGLPGVDDTVVWTGTDLADARVAELKNIYLLYNKSGKTTKPHDTIVIDLTEEAETMLKSTAKPELYLVCQDAGVWGALPDPTGETDLADAYYQLKLIQTNDYYKIDTFHTNINGTDRTGLLIDKNGGVITNTKGLTGKETPIRLVSIQIEVFTRDHDDDEPALTVINTTKGE